MKHRTHRRTRCGVIQLTGSLCAGLLLSGCGFLPISRMSRAGARPLEMAPKPTPVDSAFGDCGPAGSQPDYVLNAKKNRVDEGTWRDTPLSVIARLPWPREAALRFRNQWTSGEQRAVARYEGAPVRVEGYLLGVRLEGREPPNCYSNEPGERDFHLWLGENADASRKDAIVVEITPRVRVSHRAWTGKRLRAVVRSRERVRVSGWLMLDQMHPELVGGNRRTLWEVHPILAIDVRRGDGWVPLDSLGDESPPGPHASCRSLPRPEPEKPMNLIRVGSSLALASTLAACSRSEPSADTSMSAGTIAAADSGARSAALGGMQHDSATAAPAAGSVKTASLAKVGTYLTDASGRALYMFEKDARNSSACSGKCAEEWPPFSAAANSSADSAVQSAKLGTITRSDNAKQASYNGMPLYYYHDDTKAGDIEGQGKKEFGGSWYLVSPSGSKIEKGEGGKS